MEENIGLLKILEIGACINEDLINGCTCDKQR